MNMMIKTAKEAITAAGLAWKVDTQDVFFGKRDGLKKYDDAKAIVREDTGGILGIVGNRYVPIQNEEVFSFLDSFVDSGDVFYKAANSYKEGRIISVDLSLSREDKHIVRLGDSIETVIRVVTSHDGSERLSARLLMNRLVCKNGLVRPDTCFAFRVKHTEGAKIAIENGKELLNVARVFGSEMAETARRMAATQVTSKSARAYVLKVLNVEGKELQTRTENKLEEILALGNHGLGNNGSTLWDAYNGITEYADHHISVRGGNDRLTSSTLGGGLQLKERAYAVAQEFIAA